MTERKYPTEPRAPAVLTVDVGGSHVKAVLNGIDERRRFVSGHKLTAEEMVAGVLEQTADWEYVGVSVGVPAPVIDGRVAREPVNLGHGWAGFDFETAFGKPTKVINDAAMQALGSYEGGRMLFLGLGTGLGTTLIIDGVIAPAGDPAPAVPEGDLRGLRRRGRSRARRAQALEEARLRDHRATLRGSAPRLRRARRRQRARARRAPGELPARPQRGRIPRRLPPLGRGLTGRLGRTVVGWNRARSRAR